LVATQNGPSKGLNVDNKVNHCTKLLVVTCNPNAFMKYYKLNSPVLKKLKPFQKRASALGYWVKATNEMKLG